MESKAGKILGARASNAGDAFHEIWVTRKALELLDPGSPLACLAVEGMPVGSSRENNRSWDGVDCALFYGESEEGPFDRVEIVQLKYSPSAPEENWTLERLTKNTKQRGNNSVARRLADAFNGIIKEYGPTYEDARKTVAISLVTNQPISPSLENLVKRIRDGNSSSQDAEKLEKLRKATGLPKTRLKPFCECLDLKGGEQSRAELEVDVTRKVGQMLDSDARDASSRILMEVNRRMQPEGRGERITRTTVEGWFGVGWSSGLFPCEAKLETVKNLIERDVASDLAEAVRNNGLVCFHGGGGHGKTSVAQGLETLLPRGSRVILYDCYGAGGYRDPSQYRHRPREAFTQLSNELARKTKAPFLFPVPNTDNSDVIKSFRRRLEWTADLIETDKPETLLVILIDAADNAVAAARIPPAGECFVHDLTRMRQLPDNVRIVISTRTSRKGSLNLPPECAEVTCQPFSLEETGRFLAERFPRLSRNSVEDFHYLSDGNPRVQSSALAGRDSFEEAMTFLRPGRKSLEDIYRESVDTALLRAGGDISSELFCAVLSIMPSPAPARLLGIVCDTNENAIEEICGELAPNLWVAGRKVKVANEDFEHFCEEQGANIKDEARRRVADALHENRSDSEYAVTHLFDALLTAGRNEEIFSLLGEEDSTRIIKDPVVRRRIDLARLRISMSVVSQYGNDVEAVKTILLFSDTLESDWKMNEMLVGNLDLSARFCREEICRLVLNDPEQRGRQGALLAYLSREHALAGSAPASREAFRRVREKSRLSDQDGWEPEKDEFAAVVTGFYKNDGWKKAEKYCERYPELLSVFLKYELLKFVALSEGHNRIRSIRQKMNRRHRWIACVFIKRCGGDVSAEELENDLKALMDFGRIDDKSESRPLIDNLLFFAEICGGCGVDSGRVAEFVGKILPKEKRKIENATLNRPYLIDFSFRATRLETLGENVSLEVESVFQFPETQGDTDKGYGTERPRSFERNIRDAKRLLPFYEALAAAYAKQPDKNPDGTASGLLKKAEVVFSGVYYQQSGRIAEMLGNRVFDLQIINGTDVARTLDFFGNLIPRAFPLDALQPVMCNGEFFDNVVEVLDSYARTVESFNLPATENAYALIRISRLLLPVSEDESRAHFEKALKVVENADYELIDQLDCLLEMTAKLSWNDPRNRKRGEHLARLIIQAGTFLGDEKSFPQAKSMGALASLSAPAAACVLNRLADVGFVETDMYVDIFLRKALSRKTLPESHITALSLLAGDHSTVLTDSICESAKNLPESVRDRIVTEIAGRELMRLAPDSPKPTSEPLEHLAASFEEPNATFSKLADTHAFLKSNSLAGKPVTDIRPTAGTGVENRQKSDWSGADVPDPDAMSTEMEANRTAGYSDEKAYYSDLAKRVRPGDRIGHLDALAGIARSKPHPANETLHIANCLEKWRGEAVKKWSRETLPGLIVELSPTIMSHYSEPFKALVEASGIAGEKLKDTIVAAVERNAHRASRANLLKYAAVLVDTLPEEHAGEVFDWYVSRLNDRIDVRGTSPERRDVSIDGLPDSSDEVAAAFLYRFLGDLDVRLRWRAAHSVRAVVRLGGEGVVPALVQHALATESRTYTFGDTPFHELTARLFLAITLARVAFESPETIAAIDDDVLRLATEGPPHVLIEHYVKRALMRAAETAGARSVSAPQVTRLARPVKGYAKLTEPRAGGAFDSMGIPEGVRFSFDILDTLRYWYDPALKVFADVSPEEFLKRADHWIMDRWNADPHNYQHQDPRHKRFVQSVTSRHMGSYFFMESHARYLEWHAMCVVVGELLRTRRLAEYEDDGEVPFEEWLRRWDTVYEGAWLSDLLGPIPPEPRYWLRPDEDGPDRLESPGKEDSLAELFTETPRELVIFSYRETTKYLSGNCKAEQAVWVSCYLVPPETAEALLMALEAEPDPWNMEVANERDSDEYESRIAGFAAREAATIVRHTCDGFDSFDPSSCATTGTYGKPGDRLAEALELSQPYPWSRAWHSKKSGREICRHDSWSTEPLDDGDFAWASARSDMPVGGHRLVIDAESLMRALEYLGDDLVAVVKTKKIKGDQDETDGEEICSLRAYVLRKDGTVEDARGEVAGTWLHDS